MISHQACLSLLNTKGREGLERAQRSSREMAAVQLTLPVGLQLPVHLDLDVPIDQDLDVSLDVRNVVCRHRHDACT